MRELIGQLVDGLCARLCESDIDAAAGSVEEVDRIVTQIRARWPGVVIILRGGSRLLPRGLHGMVRGRRRACPVRIGR
jgi:hypothetical protein